MPIIDITHILCPVDLSDCSRHALEYATALARWYGARITVLHVFEHFVPAQVLPAYPGPMILTSPSRDELIAHVTRFIEPLQDPAVPFEIAVEEGPSARTILEVATARAADTIVVGTHGRGGFDHLLLGSIAERVLRKAKCPVLVVPPDAADAAAAIRFARILCPVDFSESSTLALRFACSVAKETDARLTILHVIEWSPDDSESPVEDRWHFSQKEERLRHQLEALITGDDRQVCEPVPILVHGKAYRKILELANEERTDLIVMGVAGRGAIDLRFFGSTTNHVVRQAHCPVLTLRQGAGSAEGDSSS